MQNNSLKNKKIIISAGASGIGLAITKTCLDRGATVLATDINNKFINSLKKILNIKKNYFYIILMLRRKMMSVIFLNQLNQNLKQLIV